MWRSPWSDAEGRYQPKDPWSGPPDHNLQELRMNIGTENWNLRKPNTNNLPSDTIIIDLEKDENGLFAAMKPKTRYNIRLSSRKGVSVRKAGMDELNTWYGLYKETCLRNNVFLHDIHYFKTVLETDLMNISSFVDVELLIAEKDDIPLAAMFLVYSGHRSTYLYGASSSQMRNLMPAYAIQWSAIMRSKERGCKEYDMFGVSPSSNPAHPLYGLYRFKSGFGGRIIHRMGCWDYPLKNDDYELFRSIEMKGQGYHIN
jgi:lipid II:glycine glycyltransferase (peptidoglycan interpeptide bridge formation enzyme)